MTGVAVVAVPDPSDCEEAAADAWTTDDAVQLVDVWLFEAGDDVDALNRAAVTLDAAAGAAATVAEVLVAELAAAEGATTGCVVAATTALTVAEGLLAGVEAGALVAGLLVDVTKAAP